jgi:hypothetical protein
MKHEPIFNWDENSGTASCILTDGQKVFTGFAQCHPEDMDMSSEKTGCEIAFRRARINVLRGYRDELKIKLQALNQLYHNMIRSHRFNEKSYENVMLQRQIRMINFDLTTTKEMIATEEENLRKYLSDKEEFYTKTRIRRMQRAQKADNN